PCGYPQEPDLRRKDHTVTAPTFKPGDRVRVARDTIYGAKKGAEFTITYISTPTTPEGAYASGEGFPGGVWLTDLELVETAPVPLADWEKDLLDESARPIELSEYDKELLEEIRQAATEKPLGVHLGAPDGFHRDRLIAHINDQDAVIRRRNKTIERQKAQLSEHAAEIEALKKYVSEMDKLSVTATITDTLGTIRALQKRIGEANAAKGFHEEGELLVGNLLEAQEVNNDGEYGDRVHDAERALRNYYTAR